MLQYDDPTKPPVSENTHSGKVAIGAAAASISTMIGGVATASHASPVMTAVLVICSGIFSLIAAFANKPGAPKV